MIGDKERWDLIEWLRDYRFLIQNQMNEIRYPNLIYIRDEIDNVIDDLERKQL